MTSTGQRPETMGQGVILHPGELPSYGRGGGDRTIPLAGPRIGAGFLNGLTIIAPGSAIPLHFHNCEESVVVLEGSAVAEIDGERHALSAPRHHLDPGRAAAPLPQRQPDRAPHHPVDLRPPGRDPHPGGDR